MIWLTEVWPDTITLSFQNHQEQAVGARAQYGVYVSLTSTVDILDDVYCIVYLGTLVGC